MVDFFQRNHSLAWISERYTIFGEMYRYPSIPDEDDTFSKNALFKYPSDSHIPGESMQSSCRSRSLCFSSQLLTASTQFMQAKI